MEPQRDFIVSPSLLRQFDIQFAKSRVLTTGLEFENFVEYVDKPLQTLYTEGFVDHSEDAIDDIDELLLAASQQFELENKSHQSSLLQQDSGECATFADEIDDKLLLAASQQLENQFCGLQPVPVQPEAICEGLKLESDGDVSSTLPCNRFASLSSFSDIERVKEYWIPSKYCLGN